MIDIKEFNDIFESNNYFLSLQIDVISTIVEYSYITTMNVVDWFHQFNVRRNDKFKFIIINYREQKKFNVVLMKFKNSSFYVQRQTNKLLRFYKNFVKIYVNDIIIYSRTLIEHVKHLQTIFQLFRDKRVNLTFTKFFLTYSFVILLKQRVNNLKISISTKKIVVIISLRFSHNLRDLKIFLKLIDWFRFLISRYTQRAQLLQKCKTILIKKIIAIESFKKRQINQTRFYEFIHNEIIIF